MTRKRAHDTLASAVLSRFWAFRDHTVGTGTGTPGRHSRSTPLSRVQTPSSRLCGRRVSDRPSLEGLGGPCGLPGLGLGTKGTEAHPSAL